MVSAHYPPNFVSGGTLVPERQARGLRAAGFDVSVYAGWLGDGRRPLDTFDTVDDTGLPVRWIVTTPWTAWSDAANHDNPDVTADFERHVAEVAPDVVHFHSLQSLGAGLLAPAARSGARVVVTMHDFWWSCARQFLVDRSYRPCSLVVSCGDCACEVDRPWLDARNRFLASQLVHADVVLAPSRSAAEVVVANGVPAAKVRVDENGVPAVAASAPPGPTVAGGDGATVRFLYAGGHDRMKGAHVLVDAVRLLAGVPGWRLTAYGLGPFLDDGGPGVEGLPVDVPAPFDPAAIENVFAAADVLVVPSVMRESHSILTREALTRGLPVVCAEAIGPEEVVDHGRNGLVVPAADAGALAAALRRLTLDPAMLAHLRNGCAAVPVRSVEAQVAGLGALYRSLAGGPAADAAAGGPEPFEPATDAAVPRRTVRRVVFLVGIESAPLRYRARLPAEALGLLGVHTDVRHYRDPELAELCACADAVVAYRVPATTQVLDLLAACRQRGTPVLCDLDDLIFDPDLAAEIPALTLLPPDEAALWMEGVRRYRTTMEACDAFIGSTESLCRHAEDVTGLPTERFANGVGIRLARAADATLARPRTPGPLRIGYLSGTDTHDHDWRHVEPVVVETLDAYPDVELWLGGKVTPSAALDRFGARVRRLPMLPWLELPGVLRDLDVNLAPLAPGSRFNEAKSAIKWLEAGLTATVTLASGTQPFREAIRHGHNGMLADGADQWREGLRLLLDDDLLRGALGRRARRDALLRWSPHVQATRYLEILESAPRRTRTVPVPGGRDAAPAWVPVAHDEPFAAHDLEPYEPMLAPSPAPVLGPTGRAAAGGLALRAHHAGALAGMGVRSLLDEGLRVTAARTAAVGRQRVARARRHLSSGPLADRPTSSLRPVARSTIRRLRAVRRAWDEGGRAETGPPATPEPAPPTPALEVIADTEPPAPHGPAPWPHGHFHSPVPSLDEVRRDEARIFAVPADLPGIDLRADDQLALAEQFRPLYAEQPFGDDQTSERRYWFNNDWFGWGDAIALHCMLRHLAPRRVIEVGSGFSSAVILDTNELCLDGGVRCTFIEPHPERLRGLLRDTDAEVEIIERRLQDVDLRLFEQLGAGDVLFIDSTHVSKVGSDVNTLFFDILPRLAPGVVIHIHDIFYPFEYPASWVFEGWAWNESYVLRSFLEFNDEFRILWFNSYLWRFHADAVTDALPLWARNSGGSIWLQRRLE